MLDPTKHNYYPKLIALYEQGKIPTKSLTEVDIYHDDWCAIYGGGHCSCDPEIKLRRSPGRNGGGKEPSLN
jgi:hypothetical protein